VHGIYLVGESPIHA